MAGKFKFSYLILLLSAIVSNTAFAETYIGLATTLIQIKTDTGSTRPLSADFRLGYAHERHKVELALMPGMNDDNLNQLKTEVPIAASLLYRYVTTPRHSTKVEVILGYSQIDVKSSYISIPEFTETFRGISYGIGFEEALSSWPKLKFKLDFMQLYRGDQLKINAISAGFRYEF